MNLENIRNNRIKMILQFSVPSIIAMVLTACINIVDGFFTGNYVGSSGMSAIEMGLPIVYLYLALGLMFAVGGIAIAGREFGAGNMDKCKAVFNQTFVVSTGVSIVLSIIIFIIIVPVLRLLGISGEISSYFISYYRILLLELPLMIINSTLGMFIRGEGRPDFYMNTCILTLILNAILDYIFAALLHQGIAGIAFSSFLAALITFFINIFFIVKRAKVYRFGSFKFDKDIHKEMIFNGSSEFIGELTMVISMLAYNYVILKHFGSDGLCAFTIVGFVTYVFSMIIIGFGQGIVPLVSFVYGAGEINTGIAIRRSTIKMTTAISLITMLLMVFLSNAYCTAFVKDPVIISMARNGILIYMFSFPFVSINGISSMYFTAIGNAKASAIISSSRGLVLLLIAIFTFPVLWGITGLWLVGPVVEGLTILITLHYILSEKKNLLSGNIMNEQSA